MTRLGTQSLGRSCALVTRIRLGDATGLGPPGSFASIAAVAVVTAIDALAILLEPILKTFLSNLTVCAVWTANSPLGHAIDLATMHLAYAASDFVAADLSNGAAAVCDARIALLAESKAVGAAFAAKRHAAGVAS